MISHKAAKGSDRNPTPRKSLGLSRWSSPIARGLQPLACAFCRNAALLAGTRPGKEHETDVCSRLIALNRGDSPTLWTLDLPGCVVHKGLAFGAEGSLVLALVDGQTICLGPAL
jgi:hypothetical protein